MQQVLAVIPARGGSKGIPRKNLTPLCGKPLIAHTIAAAVESAKVTRIVVSTDDQEIAEVSRTYGAEAPFLRSPELAMDHIHSADAVHDCIGRLCETGYRPDLVVMLLPTAPLRFAHHVDEAIDLFEQGGADSVIGVCDLGSYHEQLRTVEDGYLKPLARPGEAGPPASGKALNTQRQIRPKIYRPNGSIYVASLETFLQMGSFHLPRARGYEMPKINGIDIDDPEDLRTAEALFELARKA